MKKIFIVMSVAILMALFSAPSFVNAADYDVGVGYVERNGNQFITILYQENSSSPVTSLYIHSGIIYTNNIVYLRYGYNNSSSAATTSTILSGYIPGLTSDLTWTYNNVQRTIYGDYDDYIQSLPEDLRPEPPSMSEQLWDAFYDFYELIFGYRPMPGSIYDLLRNGADDEEIEITFPTLTPTPSPTPTPTPIPVQTIFVPDGNGNTTIIYQYPDPTSGVITQSPYNPNIQNNITVTCECDYDGGGSGTFTSNPQDPYSLDASLLWADGFGVVMSDNPLTTVNQQQTTLKESAMEYDSAVNVASNAFNVLPLKWIALCGLAGGILIIAGLIRTFLGG